MYAVSIAQNVSQYHDNLSRILRNNLANLKIPDPDGYEANGAIYEAINDREVFSVQPSLFHAMSMFVDNAVEVVLEKIKQELRSNASLNETVGIEYVAALSTFEEMYRDIGWNKIYTFSAVYGRRMFFMMLWIETPSDLETKRTVSRSIVLRVTSGIGMANGGSDKIVFIIRHNYM